MAQQTRKDPRAKVLSMTVRYKSATLDEFIEHHSHDVSRGGMFIKTPQPFPPGTLLKFEVRIAEDRKVMQGVGRVVWKRDGATADAERPSGMGVKFIKLDDESRGLIDQLLLARHDETSAYDSEGEGGVDGEARLGLGLSTAPSSSRTSQAPAEGSPSFFPKLDPAQLPPPEDRTVMKQAAELLEEALREVGGGDEPESTADGSFDGGSSKLASLAPAISENEETKPGRAARGEDSVARPPVVPTAAATDAGRSTALNDGLGKLSVASASKLVASAKAAELHEAGSVAKKSPIADSKPSIPTASNPRSTRPESPKPKAAAMGDQNAGDKKAGPAGAAAPRRAASATAVQPAAAPASSGGNRAFVWLGAVAASVGIIYYVTRPPAVPAPKEEPPAVLDATNVAATPAPEARAASADPATAPAPASEAASSEPSAAATASPEPSAAATASANVPEPVAPGAASAPPAPPPGAAPAAAPKPLAAKPVAPKPKTTTAPPEGPAEPAAAPPSVAPTEAKPAPAEVEAKPAAPESEVKPKAAAPAKAASKPAESDNPY